MAFALACQADFGALARSFVCVLIHPARALLNPLKHAIMVTKDEVVRACLPWRAWGGSPTGSIRCCVSRKEVESSCGGRQAEASRGTSRMSQKIGVRFPPRSGDCFVGPTLTSGSLARKLFISTRKNRGMAEGLAGPRYCSTSSAAPPPSDPASLTNSHQSCALRRWHSVQAAENALSKTRKNQNNAARTCMHCRNYCSTHLLLFRE